MRRRKIFEARVICLVDRAVCDAHRIGRDKPGRVGVTRMSGSMANRLMFAQGE